MTSLSAGDVLELLRELATTELEIIQLSQASQRTFLVVSPHLANEVMLRGSVFVKNNMRSWRQATPELAPLGLHMLRLPHVETSQIATLQSHTASEIASAILYIAEYRLSEFCINPLFEMQRLLSELLTPMLFGDVLDYDLTEVIRATDQLEQSYGIRQLQTFFAVNPDYVLDEKNDLDARIVLHQAFRRTYFSIPRQDVDISCLEAFIALYRAAVASPATTLVWVCKVLALQYDMQCSIRAQLSHPKSAKAGRAMLNSLLWETLRLYPPAWLLVRIAQVKTQLGQQTIVPGDHILVSPYLQHRSTRLWKNAEQFVPERFLSSTPSPFKKLMSFGHGRRKCPAMNFSLQLLSQLAEQLVLRFNIKLVESASEEFDLWVNYRPASDTHLKVERV